MYAVLHNESAAVFFLGGMGVVGVPWLGVIFNVCAFPWSYSVLGRLTRTSFPSEEPVAAFHGCWARVGNLRMTWPCASWLVFSSGLGMRIDIIGKAFLPLETILAWEQRWIGYTVYHNSPEVRSPLAMPEKVYTALAQAMSRKNYPFPAARVI